jgi:hypothetical protein
MLFSISISGIGTVQLENDHFDFILMVLQVQSMNYYSIDGNTNGATIQELSLECDRNGT